MRALLVFLLMAPPDGEAEPVEPTEEAAPDPAAAQAQELYQLGRSLYGTSDYDGAIDAFTKAFISSDQIADDDLRYNVNVALTFNLARAHMKGYGNDRKPEHVRKAVDLLEKYLELDLEASDVKEAQGLLAEAKTMLEEIEREDQAAEAAAAATPTTSSADPGAAPQTPANDEPAPARSDARGLKIGGYALLGVGAVGLGLGGAGLAMGNAAQQAYEAGPLRADRDAAEQRGQTANVLSYAGAAVGAVGLVGGAVLLGIAAKRGKSVALSPAVSPTFAGAVVNARF